MAQRIIGLDIGSWSIKTCVLESSIRKTAMVSYDEHHIPREPSGGDIEGAQLAAVTAALEGLEADTVASAVPGSRVMMRRVKLPFVDDKRIATVLGFQLETELPMALEDVVYDYQVVAKDDDGATLLCPAVDRAWLDTHLAELKEAGANPRYLSLASMTNANLSEYMDFGDTDTPVALIDIGHKFTSVTVVKDGAVAAARTVSRGGHQLTLAVMKGMDLDYGQAEAIKHGGIRFDGYLPPGIDQAEHAARARHVAKALEPFLREIRVTLHAQEQQLGQEVTQVVVFGGSARMPGLVELVGRVLDRTATSPVLSGPLWTEMAGVESFDVGALPSVGLALRHVQDSAGHQPNFRQGAMAFESDFKALRDRAVWIGVFAMILLALFFGRKYFQMKTLQGQQAALVAQLDAHTERVFETTLDDDDDPLAKFDLVKEMMLAPAEAGTENVYPPMTAFKVFYDVSEAQAAVNAAAKTVEEPVVKKPGEETDEEETVKVKAEVELRTIAAEVKSAVITGVAYDIETIEALATQLKKHHCFKKVDRQETKSNQYGQRKGWMTFTIKIDVECDLEEDKDKEGDKKEAAKDDGADKAPKKATNKDEGKQ